MMKTLEVGAISDKVRTALIEVEAIIKAADLSADDEKLLRHEILTALPDQLEG